MRRASALDRVDGAQDRTPQRGVAEDGLRERVVHEVGRVVVAHRDLFEDHAALVVDVGVEQQRGVDHVADDVDRDRQVGVEHPRVEAGVLLGGEGVHLTADPVDAPRRSPARPPPGALEEQVLEVVRAPAWRT